MDRQSRIDREIERWKSRRHCDWCTLCMRRPRLSLHDFVAFLSASCFLHKHQLRVSMASNSSTSVGSTLLAVDENEYQYQPLPPRFRSPLQVFFRLVDLLPGRPEDPICYEVRLADYYQFRDFEALSYAWGNYDVRIPIVCDGKLLNITPNLHAALKALRLPYQSRSIWVDAISINQNDIGKRSAQVKEMLGIYGRAVRVIVWLGSDELDELGESKALKAKILIDHIATELVKITGHVLWNASDQLPK